LQETEGGLFWGNTTLYPGSLGDEYFMTKGHFHRTRNRGEFYVTRKGEGALLLMEEGGATTEEMTSHAARTYPELELSPDLSLYEQFIREPDSLMYVSEPWRKEDIWRKFVARYDGDEQQPILPIAILSGTRFQAPLIVRSDS
jgi:Glucose-6-phosphate isomerase (GPI)